VSAPAAQRKRRLKLGGQIRGGAEVPVASPVSPNVLLDPPINKGSSALPESGRGRPEVGVALPRLTPSRGGRTLAPWLVRPVPFAGAIELYDEPRDVIAWDDHTAIGGAIEIAWPWAAIGLGIGFLGDVQRTSA
jgi:hypothetical protein